MELRDIPSLPGYSASSCGVIINRRGVVQRTSISAGYLGFTIKRERRYKWLIVSRLVAEAWLSDFRPDMQVDHINRDPLDNRAENLRMATPSQNSFNRSRTSKNKSGYVGVVLHKPTQKWQAQIGLMRRTLYLGLFDTPEAAAAARTRKALELFSGYVPSEAR